MRVLTKARIIPGVFLVLAVLFLAGVSRDFVLRRKAEPVKATVNEALCKHRIAGGKSKVWVMYEGQEYDVPVTRDFCDKAVVGAEVLLYYSRPNDTLYLNTDGKYSLILVGLVAVGGSIWLLRRR